MKSKILISMVTLLVLSALLTGGGYQRAEAEDLSTWISATPLPFPMAGGIVRCADDPDSFYFGSAIIRKGNNSRLFYRYDIADASWVKLKNKPDAMRGGGFVCYQGKIYVAGGTDLKTVFNTLYIYDIATNSWSEGPALPEPVFSPGLAAYDGKLYLVGGTRDMAVEVDRVDVLDLATGVWTAGGAAPMPSGAWGFGYARLGDHFYAVGGTDGNNDEYGNSIYTQRYDFSANEWESYANFYSLLAYGSLAVTNTHLYYLGGDIDDGEYAFHSTDQVLVYDLTNWPDGEWIDLEINLPVPNLVPATTCTENLSGGEIWLVGGGIDAYHLYTEVYYLPVGEGCP
jgi:hypothetical protein